MNRWIYCSLVVAFLIVPFRASRAEEAETRPAGPALDEVVLKLCRRMMEVHESKLADEKVRVAKVKEVLEAGIPLLKEKLRESFKTYREAAPDELKKAISQYAAEYKRIAIAQGLDEQDRHELQEYLGATLGETITTLSVKHLDYNGPFSPYRLDISEKFDGNGSASIECKVANGKTVVCANCSFHPKNEPANRCSIAYTVDVNTGTISGLDSLEDQVDLLESNTANVSSSDVIPNRASDYNSRVKSLEDGAGLPRVCKKLWRQEQGAKLKASAKPEMPPAAAAHSDK